RTSRQEVGHVAPVSGTSRRRTVMADSTLSAADLIRLADEDPPKPVIEDLLYEGDVLLLHGKEESFKSVLVMQTAESIAAGLPLLRLWRVTKPRIVGVINTEINERHFGKRLAKMFPDGNAPERLRFMSEKKLR